MPIITGMPRGAMDSENPAYPSAPVMVPLAPSENEAYTELAVTTTAATHSLTGVGMVKIRATDYPARFRFLTVTDTDAVTSSNARDYIGAYDSEYYAIPSGATGISVMTIGGDATVVIVEF